MSETLWSLLAFSEKNERHEMMATVIGLTLAWQIRALRHRRGWSQEDVARRMGTTQTAIARLENPKLVLRSTMKTLMKVAAVFDVALVCRLEDWKDWVEKMMRAEPPRPFTQEQLTAAHP